MKGRVPFHGLHNSTINGPPKFDNFRVSLRYVSTSEGSSSSVRPISIAPIALSAARCSPAPVPRFTFYAGVDNASTGTLNIRLAEAVAATASKDLLSPVSSAAKR